MRVLTLLAPVACLLFSAVGHASTGELYGYGSRASAMGNTMLGGTSDGNATFYNPGANSLHPGLNVSLAVSYEHPHFLDIKGITVANNSTTAQTGDVIGDVDNTTYLDHLGETAAISLNMGDVWKNLTAGLVAFLPLTRVAYIDTGDPFLPEYVSYRSRTQRPQIYGSLSATPLSFLHLGMGLAISTNLSATTSVFVTSSANSASHQQFASTIKPGVAPYFSFYADPKPLELGGTVRLPNRSKVSIDTNAHARLLGNTNDLPLVVNSSSTIYYDPLEFDFAVGYHIGETWFVTAEADWFQYKAFETPTLVVTDLGSGPTLQNSVNTSPTFRNIIVLKTAFEKKFELITLRAGYWHRPSPITDNSGPGNLVDPERHSFTAGIGVDLQKAKLTEKSIILDLHAQYHVLVTQHITKSANNEVGASGSTKVGSPGYDIGGGIAGGGFSLSMSF
ncbi:MAG: hypothetical protein HY074_08200 [Deltaproteobacteria bacterium]|nr:hypothetical protein [Deltaproteobacteria bacterium]